MLEPGNLEPRVAAGLLLVAGVLAAGCFQSDKGNAGGESHFLSRCDDGCAGGLSCLGGICTRPCGDDATLCDAFGEGAQCTGSGADAVCDLGCDEDADCAGASAELRCDDGLCREPPPVAAGAQCRVAYQLYDSGTQGIQPPMGCGECSCLDGELACSPAPCDVGAEVTLCPSDDPDGDAFETLGFAIDGDRLSIMVGHGGGCASHDFLLCHGGVFGASDPVDVELRLIHDAHDDSCSGDQTLTLDFDLSSLARLHTELLQGDGGIISTRYGYYVFGELSCQEMREAASLIFREAEDRIDRSCQSAADCVRRRADTMCTRGCTMVVSEAGRQTLSGILGRIDRDACASYVEDGCPPPDPPPCPEPPGVDCVDGECVFAFQ